MMKALEPQLLVLTGPMKSGKSDLLIQYARKRQEQGVRVSAFKPSTDTRDIEIKSRSGLKIDCQKVHPKLGATSIRFAVLAHEPHTVIIDEFQFMMSYDYIRLVQELVAKGYEVIIAGLDMTSDKEPFGLMPYAMCIADHVNKLHGWCENCTTDDHITPSVLTFADFEKTDSVAVESEQSTYKSVCRSCWEVLTKLKTQNS